MLMECGIPAAYPLPLWMDNQAVIKQLRNESSACKSKHMDLRLKFVRKHESDGVIDPKFVPTDAQAANVFTKALPGEKLKAAKIFLNLE